VQTLPSEKKELGVSLTAGAYDWVVVETEPPVAPVTRIFIIY
jgi:hypothetical protein